MNQDHLQQQPAADAYVIGGPSEFAEDLSNSGPGWKADLGADGNTKRDEIGLPELRGDTFNKSDKAPGVSPSRQASVEEIHAKAEVATKVARRMLPKTSSERSIENQALVLMDLPLANLKNTLTRLAEAQGQDEDEDDEDEDEGQQKQAADDEDEDEEKGQSKQADLPPEFLEQQKKMKDKAKDKDKKDDDKGQDKEARRRLKAQQQEDDEEEEQQQQQKKQARRVKAQQQDDEEDQAQQQKQARRVRAQDQEQEQDDEGQPKQARRVKAQDQDQDQDDEGQQKQARRVKAQEQQQDKDDEGQQKEAAEQEEKKEGQEQEEKQVGKEAYALIKQAATDLLAVPVAARGPIFKAMLPSLSKVAAYGMQQQGQQQVATDQIMAQVQQLVQQAMQQQQQQQQAQQQQQSQQQPQQAQDQALVDQMLQEPAPLEEDQIQLDAPDMDLGLAGEEDPALQAIFASDAEVQRALEARDLERGHQPTAASQTRTASTRTVGTRPSAGVSLLGGGSSGNSSGTDEISKLSTMWSSAPDVSSVFRS